MGGGGQGGPSGGQKVTTTTTDSEDNTEQLAREECSRLSRQLRLMENDKKAYIEESNAQINQQKKAIIALEKENSQLEAELDIYRSKYSKEQEEMNMSKVFEIIEHYNVLEAQEKQQSKLISEVEKKLKLVGSRVAKLKVRLEATETAQELPLPQLEKKEFILKKKLETVTAQFDIVVASNSELRLEIDEILTQNIAVMEKSTQLEKQSNKVKGTIDELVDQATAAYDQREEAVAKATALFERNVKEKKLFKMEISELSRIIRNEEKLLDFMSTKNKERHYKETDDERISRLEQAKEQFLDETLESYKENFTKLLTKDSPTLKHLVEEFSELQHKNIAKFTYINELNNEIEALQEETNEIREDIKKYSLETVERNQAKNVAIIKRQGELDELRNDYRYIQIEMVEYKTAMEEIVRLIQRLFHITDCSGTAPVLELIGRNQQGISTKNAILYVNILEHRIRDIFALKNNGEDNNKPGVTTPSLRSPRPPSKTTSDISGTTTRPRILISAQEESEDRPHSDDELTQNLVEAEPSPLGYTEMREKVLDAVSRRSTSSVSGDDSVVSNALISS